MIEADFLFPTWAQKLAHLFEFVLGKLAGVVMG